MYSIISLTESLDALYYKKEGVTVQIAYPKGDLFRQKLAEEEFWMRWHKEIQNHHINNY